MADKPDGGPRHYSVDVPPFHAVVEFNGWPAGLLTPYGGTLAAGSGANEATLIAALKAALAAKTT